MLRLGSTFQKNSYSFKKSGTEFLKMVLNCTSQKRMEKGNIVCYQEPVPELLVSAKGCLKINARKFYVLNQELQKQIK